MGQPCFFFGCEARNLRAHRLCVRALLACQDIGPQAHALAHAHTHWHTHACRWTSEQQHGRARTPGRMQIAEIMRTKKRVPSDATTTHTPRGNAGHCDPPLNRSQLLAPACVTPQLLLVVVGGVVVLLLQRPLTSPDGLRAVADGSPPFRDEAFPVSF